MGRTMKNTDAAKMIIGHYATPCALAILPDVYKSARIRVGPLSTYLKWDISSVGFVHTVSLCWLLRCSHLPTAHNL